MQDLEQGRSCFYTPMIQTHTAPRGRPVVELDGRRKFSNFSELSIIVDTKALPQLNLGRSVALVATHGCPLGDVLEHLDDNLCHILVQPELRSVTGERQTSWLYDQLRSMPWSRNDSSECF